MYNSPYQLIRDIIEWSMLGNGSIMESQRGLKL